MSGSPDENKKRPVVASNEEYILFKARKIKEAARNGNEMEAQRQTNELLSYLGEL